MFPVVPHPAASSAHRTYPARKGHRLRMIHNRQAETNGGTRCTCVLASRDLLMRDGLLAVVEHDAPQAG